MWTARSSIRVGLSVSARSLTRAGLCMQVQVQVQVQVRVRVQVQGGTSRLRFWRAVQVQVQVRWRCSTSRGALACASPVRRLPSSPSSPSGSRHMWSSLRPTQPLCLLLPPPLLLPPSVPLFWGAPLLLCSLPLLLPLPPSVSLLWSARPLLRFWSRPPQMNAVAGHTDVSPAHAL